MRKWRHASIVVPAFSLLAALAGSSLAATHGPPQQAPSAEPQIDPQARDALTRMGEAFKSLTAYAVHEDTVREQVINGDLKVQKALSADILVRRPDRLKADITGDDDRNHETFYDGKTLTVYIPAKKYFAQTPAPDSIGATLDMAEANYGIEFPTPDLLRASSGEDFAKDLTAAGLVGTSRVGDDECEHFAYRSNDVDYQLWLEKGDKPLPRKFVITSKKDPTQPEYVAVLTWNLSPKVDDAAFVFTAPEGASRIPLGVLTSGAPKNPSMKPPARK
jgi:hypothetical protein